MVTATLRRTLTSGPRPVLSHPTTFTTCSTSAFQTAFSVHLYTPRLTAMTRYAVHTRRAAGNRSRPGRSELVSVLIAPAAPPRLQFLETEMFSTSARAPAVAWTHRFQRGRRTC